MEIIKKVMGHDIKLVITKIKDYPRYRLYQVYRVINKKYIPLYKTCFTDYQICEIAKHNNTIIEEVFE